MNQGKKKKRIDLGEEKMGEERITKSSEEKKENQVGENGALKMEIRTGAEMGLHMGFMWFSR